MAKRKTLNDADILDPRSSHDDLPTTVGLVKQVRLELRHDIRAIEKKLNSRLIAHDSQFESLKTRMEEHIAISHRTQVLMEEQRSENRIVMDGITALRETFMERFKQTDDQINKFHHTLQLVVKAVQARVH